MFSLLPAQSDTTKRTVRWECSLREKWIVADQHYNDAGEKHDNVAEYGIYSTTLEVNRYRPNGFEFRLVVPVITHVYAVLPMSGTKQSDWRTGTLRVMIKQPIVRNSFFNVSAALDLGLPLVDALEFEIQPTAAFSPSQRLMVLATKRFPRIRGSIGIAGGFRNYSGGLSDEWHYGLSGNLNLSQTRLSLCLCGISSLRNGDAFFGNFSETLYANNASSLMLSPGIDLKLSPEFSVGLGIDAMLHAENRLAGTAYDVTLNLTLD